MSRESQEHGADREPLEAIERTLAAWEPAPPRIDRDRLMFLAGQASVEGSGFRVQGSGIGDRESGVGRSPRAGSNWLWPASTAALAATSLALAVALVMRPGPRVEIVYRDRPVEVASDATPPVEGTREDSPAWPVEVAVNVAPHAHAAPPRRTEPVPAQNYLRIRDVALRMGLDALGSPRPGGGGTTAAPTYRELLENMEQL